ncbi:alpha/beta fold hydrolase [Deinococcus sp. VB343]|uniref:Alpha/beta hydrolase n=1 Tax=Deinococcus sp. VB142 TaxID=3112952 RepID=A0AAU6Q0Z1_9DEIO
MTSQPSPEPLPAGIYEAHLNGADLYFEVVGEATPAAPLVYLHGGPGYNSFSFRELLGERLEDLGRRVVYLDQRGCGRSGALEDTEQAKAAGDADTLDLDTLVADVEELRDFLGAEQIVPLGHGFGALIALEYARRYPTRTSRAVVVNPWVHFPALALTLLREASALAGAEFEDPAVKVRAQTPEGQHPPIGAARIEAAFARLNARDLLNALQFVDPQSRMRLEFLDVESQLLGGAEMQQALVNQGLWEFEYPAFMADIRRPVFVIAGVHDRTSYPEQTDWVVDLAGGDLTVLDTGHYPWLDDEDAFVEALDEALTR